MQLSTPVAPQRPSASPSTPDITTRAVASPAPSVSIFNTTILKRPFRVRFFDNATQDGDVVSIILNGQVVVPSLTLTNAGQIVEFREPILRSGVNRLEIAALNEGSIQPNTVSFEYSADQVLENAVFGRSQDLRSGQSFVTTVGFPQIALCRTRFQFPCVVNTPTPEAAQHVLEALGIPPEPITAPLIPGRTGNPLRLSYPRLLTLSRNSTSFVNARRVRSTSAYACPSPSTHQRDEYPPASVAENFGSAHIKCISGSDNGRAGLNFRFQINAYARTLGESGVQLTDGSTIEFVILP